MENSRLARLMLAVKLYINKLLPAAVEDRFDWFYLQYGLSGTQILELKNQFDAEMSPEEKLGRYLATHTDKLVVMRFIKPTSSLIVSVGDSVRVGSSTYLNVANQSFTWLFRRTESGLVMLEVA